jgi:hypothetical protein
MADQKLSELSAATGASSSDSLYVVQSGVSKRITAQNLASSMTNLAASIYTVINSSVTVTSAGTSETTDWFRFSDTQYSAVKIDFVAVDTGDTQNHTVGTYWLVTDDVDYPDQPFEDSASVFPHGPNQITIPTARATSNTVGIKFVRQSADSDPIRVRYTAHLYKR